MVDALFMQKALDEAWKYQGLTFPNPPVGALIVDKDKNIISIGVHKRAGLAHAELDAVYNALLYYKKEIPFDEPSKLHSYIRKNYKNFFKEHNIYVTLEPCNHFGKTPPCSLLLKDMGFKRVVVSTLDVDKNAIGGVKLLSEYADVTLGVLEEEGKKLLLPFKLWQNKKPFIFFKVAVSKNWVYTGGIISSKNSRQMVHRIREVTDLLVIGGKSVRVDRPTLDTRLSSGKNPPDVLILSREDDFDRDIPLFKVKNRKVIISSDFDSVVKDYSYVMVEGGKQMYQLLKDRLDVVMIFQTEKDMQGESFEFAKEFDTLKKFKYFDDTIMWKIKKDLL